MRDPWRKTLKVGDVFHDDDLPLAEKAAMIASRMRHQLGHMDPEIDMLAEELVDAGKADDVDWFDGVWSAFYDWADAFRVWVETHQVSQPDSRLAQVGN